MVHIVLLVLVPIINGFFKEALKGIHDHMIIVLQMDILKKNNVSNSKISQKGLNQGINMLWVVFLEQASLLGLFLAGPALTGLFFLGSVPGLWVALG